MNLTSFLDISPLYDPENELLVGVVSKAQALRILPFAVFFSDRV